MEALQTVERSMFGLYCMLTVVGGIGNLLVQIVIIKNKDLKHSMHILLFNLSVADLLFLMNGALNYLSLAFPHLGKLYFYAGYECYIFNIAFNLFLNGSALTLIAISLERYLIVCRPLLAKVVITKSRTLVAIFIIWLISLLSVSDHIHASITVHKLSLNADNITWGCFHNNFHASSRVVFYLFGVVPLILLAVINLMTVCKLRYGITFLNPRENASQAKARKQVIIMMAVVVLLFIMCMIPYRVFIYLTFNEKSLLTFGDPFVSIVVLHVVALLFYVNASINPIVYAFISERYRNEFKKIVCCYGDDKIRQ